MRLRKSTTWPEQACAQADAREGLIPVLGMTTDQPTRRPAS